MNGIRESLLSLDLFLLALKIFFWPSYEEGGGIAPIARPYGSATRRRIGLYMQCDAFPFSHSVACKLLAVHRNKIVVLAECYRRSSVHKKITYNDMLQSVGLLYTQRYDKTHLPALHYD